MSDPYWFQKKWGTYQPQVPLEDLYQKVLQLEEKVSKLEEENVETTNVLYELMNSIQALDNRIDILASNPWENQFND